MRNFCIQRLVHFFFKNRRKFDSKKVKSNCFEWDEPARDVALRTRHVVHAITGPRAHAEAPEDPAVRGPRRCHCAARANDVRRGA
jgi:hypothetical protein